MVLIRIKRIKKVVEELINSAVEIHQTTELSKLIAFLIQKDGKYVILISSKICKREEEVVAAIVHETTHVLIGSPKHTNNFYKKLREVALYFDDKMGYEKGTVLKYIGELDKVVE